jgi:chemotaxis protein CheD
MSSTDDSAPRATRASLRQDSTLEQLPVRIGEIRVAPGSSLLFTLGLGSCVAIVLHDAAACIGGLAHPMLPDPSNGHPAGPPGRYVSRAVPDLIAAMLVAGAAHERLHARLVGGASMFRDVLEGDGLRLGRRNVEAAHEALARAGIAVAAEAVLGTCGRSAFLHTTSGELLVTSVNHPDVIL